MTALTSLERIQLAKCYKNKANNADSRGLEFDISILTFANIKAQKVCAYSGLPFGTGDDGLSIERIDNNVGYVDGNVIPVRNVLNSLRADYDIPQVEAKVTELAEKLRATMVLYEHAKSKLSDANIALKTLPVEVEVVSRTVIKPRIPAAIYTKWRHRYNECVGARNKLSVRETLIAESVQILRKPGLNEKRVKSHKALIAVHESKLTADQKLAQSKNDRYRDYVKGFKTESRVVEITDNSAIERLEKARQVVEAAKLNVERLHHEIENVRVTQDHFKHILAGLKKFDKLSDADALKVKLGLSLDTSMLKVLKHKLGYSCLVNQL